MERRGFLKLLLGAAAAVPILRLLPAVEPFLETPPSLAPAYVVNLKAFSEAMKVRVFPEMERMYRASSFLLADLDRAAAAATSVPRGRTMSIPLRYEARYRPS